MSRSTSIIFNSIVLPHLASLRVASFVGNSSCHTCRRTLSSTSSSSRAPADIEPHSSRISFRSRDAGGASDTDVPDWRYPSSIPTRPNGGLAYGSGHDPPPLSQEKGKGRAKETLARTSGATSGDVFWPTYPPDQGTQMRPGQSSKTPSLFDLSPSQALHALQDLESHSEVEPVRRRRVKTVLEALERIERSHLPLSGERSGDEVQANANKQDRRDTEEELSSSGGQHGLAKSISTSSDSAAKASTSASPSSLSALPLATSSWSKSAFKGDPAPIAHTPSASLTSNPNLTSDSGHSDLGSDALSIHPNPRLIQPKPTTAKRPSTSSTPTQQSFQSHHLPRILRRLISAGLFRLAVFHILQTPDLFTDTKLCMNVSEQLEQGGATKLAWRLRKSAKDWEAEMEAAKADQAQAERLRVDSNSRAPSGPRADPDSHEVDKSISRRDKDQHPLNALDNSSITSTDPRLSLKVSTLFRSTPSTNITARLASLPPRPNRTAEQEGERSRLLTRHYNSHLSRALFAPKRRERAEEPVGTFSGLPPIRSGEKLALGGSEGLRSGMRMGLGVRAASLDGQTDAGASGPGAGVEIQTGKGQGEEQSSGNITSPRTKISTSTTPQTSTARMSLSSSPLPRPSPSYAQLRSLIHRISILEKHRGFKSDFVTANLVVRSWLTCWGTAAHRGAHNHGHGHYHSHPYLHTRKVDSRGFSRTGASADKRDGGGVMGKAELMGLWVFVRDLYDRNIPAAPAPAPAPSPAAAASTTESSASSPTLKTILGSASALDQSPDSTLTSDITLSDPSSSSASSSALQLSTSVPSIAVRSITPDDLLRQISAFTSSISRAMASVGEVRGKKEVAEWRKAMRGRVKDWEDRGVWSSK